MNTSHLNATAKYFSLTHSLTRSLAHSLTHALTHPLTHLHHLPLTQLTHSLTHSLSRSPTHSHIRTRKQEKNGHAHASHREGALGLW